MKKALDRRKEIKDTYDEIAPIYEGILSLPVAKSIERSEIKTVSRLLDVEGKSILDIGCGYGKFSREWEEKGARLVVGMDFSKSMLKRATARSGDSFFVLGDAFNPPFKDKSFNFSTCIGLTLYYDNIGELFEEVRRVTKEACVVSFPPRSLLGITYATVSKLKIPYAKVERVKELCSQIFERHALQCTSYGALICTGYLSKESSPSRKSEKDRLVIVSDTYFPMKDGVLTYLRSVVPLLSGEYHITLVAPKLKGGKGMTFKGIETVLLRPLPIELASYRIAVPSLGLARAIRRADLVLVNDLAPLGAAAVRIAHAMKKPLFLFCHHDEGEMLLHAFKLREKPLLPADKLFRLVDRIVAKHYSYADAIFVATYKFYEKLRRLRVPEEKIIFAPFAVDCERFSPGNGRAKRRELGIPGDAKVVLYLGRMSHEKNVETLVRSVLLVQLNFEDVWFVFAGGGPKLKEYERLAESIGASDSDSVIFTGEVEWEEVSEYLSAADVFVHPSLHESQSFTVMEAMATSLPVIVLWELKSEYSYLEEGVSCVFLKDAKSCEELAGHICHLLKNSTLRAELGRNARERIKGYSWEEHISKMKYGFEDVRPPGNRPGA